MIYVFRYLISVMLHTVSIIFNASICFDRLGDTFFTWRRSRFGKELKRITNNNNNHHHHRRRLENSLILGSCERQTTQNTHRRAALKKY